MAVITKITTQKKNNERYNVFLDHGDGKEVYGFSVDQDVLIKFHLKKGLELDDLDLTEIHFDDEVKKAMNMAAGFLSHRMRSAKEVHDYLATKEIDGPIILEVLHKLTELNYVNDKEFAHAFVRTQVNTTVKGPEVIKKELIEKGIDKEIIETALNEFGIDYQLESAKKIAEKAAKQSKMSSNQVLKQKVEQALLRKGYNWSIIQQVLEESNFEKEDNEIWEALVFQGEKAHRKYQKYEGFAYSQKMKQALFRKGFAIELIEKFIEMKQHDEDM